MKPQNPFSWLSVRLLTRLIPADLREAFIGDLVEEAQSSVRLSSSQWRLRLWLVCQMIISIPALLGLRIIREGSIMKRRLSVAALMATMGVLQAWDSQVFQSSAWIIGIVLVGIFVPVVTILRTQRYSYFAMAIVVACILLILARITTPTPLGSDLLTAVIVIWAASLLVYRPYLPSRANGDDRVA